MPFEIFPFSFTLNPLAVAGAALWSLALYLGASPLSHWVMVQLVRWFNFAERSLYTSEAEFERTRQARESQNAFYASIFSIVPFLILGSVCYALVSAGLNPNWGVSLGLLAAMGCGIYELGRRSSEAGNDE
jgi:hypothetical protein